MILIQQQQNNFSGDPKVYTKIEFKIAKEKSFKRFPSILFALQ